tara:strand:- start:1828 stop:2295 length:468 start_codon:yes stop_codon:yes gene_type:complete
MTNPKLKIEKQAVTFEADKNTSGHYEANFRLRANKVKKKIEVNMGKKLTHAAIAEIAGAETETIARIFNGSQKNIRLGEAIGIAKALHTTVSYLANSEDTTYMLENTRRVYDYLRSDHENNVQAQGYLKDREKEITKNIDYFEAILLRVDALDEH